MKASYLALHAVYRTGSSQARRLATIGRLDAFRTQVARHWHKAIRRRSQRDLTGRDKFELEQALRRLEVVREGFVVRNLDGSAKTDGQTASAQRS